MSPTLYRWLLRGGITFAVVWLLLFSVLACVVAGTTWSITTGVLKQRKQEQAQRDHEKRMRYLRTLPPPTADDFFKPAKVHPNVRDLP